MTGNYRCPCNFTSSRFLEVWRSLMTHLAQEVVARRVPSGTRRVGCCAITGLSVPARDDGVVVFVPCVARVLCGSVLES